ncbi:MAG: ankyrin repeat domain-containing protein [Gemmatimonadetes bacterium]|nr:ankyrin repeat domain-containing protein [Gemmatimonadota bacterium]
MGMIRAWQGAALALGVLAADAAAQGNAPANGQGGAPRDTRTAVRVPTSRAVPAQQVVQAAQRGDLAELRQLLAAGGDPNAASGDGMTPLHWAAERGDSAMAAALLRAKASVSATTRIGAHTPLHIAARTASASVARQLLAAGADPNARTTTGASAVHLAATGGNAGIVQAMLAKGGDANATEKNWGQTPLMFAATANRAEAVQALLKGGADPARRTARVDLTEENQRQQAAARKRNELLFAALPTSVQDSLKQAFAKAAAERAAMMRQFAGGGGGGGGGRPAAGDSAAPAAAAPAAAAPAAAAPAAATRPDSTRAAPRPYSPGLNTPPVNALSPEVVEQAIKAGREVLAAASVPKAPTEQGELFEGQVAGYEATVGSLGGLTALHHAVRQGNTAAALALVDGGADINTVTAGDSTSPLLMAAINGHYDLALALVKRGANVQLASTAGLTPLYAALNTFWSPKSRYPQPQSVQVQATSHLQLMDALIQAGADVNVRLRKNLWFFGYNNCGNANCGLEYLDGTTPFWRAVYAVDLEAMKLLKAAGAIDTLPSYREPANNRARAALAARFGGAGGPPLPGTDFATDSAAKAAPVGIGVYPIHAAAGVGYGNGFAGNSHRHAPDGWMPAMKYLVEVLGHDVNQRDLNGYTALHHAASRGDNEMILYLVSKGADPKAVARNGRTTVDMANGPVQRLRPFPETIALLEKMGAKNNHRCVGC